MGHRLSHRGQHGAGIERRLKPLAQARDHPVGVVTFSVHQAVHATLKPVPQRRKQDGDEACGDE